MKLSQIVYPLTKPNVSFAISVYHKKIFFSNNQRIPSDKPILFVSNHPTAFLEPVIYAGMLRKPIYSLVRGDFFQNTLAKIGLESLNMIAIYRMRDGGVQGLRKNAETFQYCYDLLSRNKQVLIMAEGFTKQQKRLAPIQKGAARLALGAAKACNLENLVIIPLGANFTAANTFRGEVMIEVGQQIEISSYLNSYDEDKKKAIDDLTRDIEIALKKSLVHIELQENDQYFESLVPILRRKIKYLLTPFWIKESFRFNLEKSLADKINKATQAERLEMEKLAKAYPENINLRSRNIILEGLFIIGLFPFWVSGKIYGIVPFSIARYIVNKKVKVLEFQSPIRFGMGALFFILWSWLMILISAIILGVKWVILPLLMPFVVMISFIYEDLWKHLQHALNWHKLSADQRKNALTIEHKIGNFATS